MSRKFGARIFDYWWVAVICGAFVFPIIVSICETRALIGREVRGVSDFIVVTGYPLRGTSLAPCRFAPNEPIRITRALLDEDAYVAVDYSPAVARGGFCQAGEYLASRKELDVAWKTYHHPKKYAKVVSRLMQWREKLAPPPEKE